MTHPTLSLLSAPTAHLAAWAAATFPGASRPLLAAGAVVAGIAAAWLGARLVAAVLRLALVAAGCYVGWLLVRG